MKVNGYRQVSKIEKNIGKSKTKEESRILPERSRQFCCGEIPLWTCEHSLRSSRDMR